MEISITTKNKTLIVAVCGELDHHSAKSLKETVEEVIENRGIVNLIFDFTKLTFMDSSGIGVVLGRYKLIRAFGGNVAIINRSEKIQRLLQMSGMIKLISVFTDTEEAIYELEGRYRHA